MSDCTSCRWGDTVKNKTVVNTFGNTTVIQNGANNTTCTNTSPNKVTNIDENFDITCSEYEKRK